MQTRKLAPVALWPQESEKIGEPIPTLTPYLLADNILTAAIVVCPGGGYGHLAAHEGEPIALWLNSIGIAAFVLHYRVAPARHPAPIQDARRAIRMIRHNMGDWAVDPRRIGILGFSAGGHCAASAAILPELPEHQRQDDAFLEIDYKPNLFIACYPVITFNEHGHEGSLKNLLGKESAQITAAEREAFSLEKQVDADTPPAFIWHTANDQAVPVENSLLLSQALSRHKIPFQLHIFPDGPHGLGLAQDNHLVSVWPDLCSEWLEQMSFAEF